MARRPTRCEQAFPGSNPKHLLRALRREYARGLVATVITALVIFVIIFHLWAMVLEMFLWTKPLGRKTFGLSKEDAESSKTLAANQGLYNGFLAAGLVLSFLVQSSDTAFTLQVFFLSCVALAGLYGGITAKMSILFMQGLPAMIALGLLLLT